MTNRIFFFVDLFIKYLSNATFGTVLTFHINVLEMLEEANFGVLDLH